MRTGASRNNAKAPPRQINIPRLELERKIRSHGATVGVIGLGTVGLSLAVEMATAGFQVKGIDLEADRVNAVNAGISDHFAVPSEELLPLVATNRIKATQALATVEALDVAGVCVPTRLRNAREPSFAYVVAAIEAIRNHLRPGQLIVVESTAYPGAMRDLILPILEESGLQVGEDFFLAYSPQRIDPGNEAHASRNIPKIVSGMTPFCAELAVLFYRQFFKTVIPASSPETAEMVKLLENTFSCVNTAIANEMTLLSHKLGINVWEVIEAAQTKPFGFMAFYPEAGLGGDSLPINAGFPASKSTMNGFRPRLIELASDINSQMCSFIIERVADALNENGKSLKHSRIVVLGVSNKRDVQDRQDLRAIEVMRGLQQKGVDISYADPYVKSLDIDGVQIRSTQLSAEVVQSMDCFVLLNDHSDFNYTVIAAHDAPIIDGRNGFKEFSRSNIIPL